MASSELDLPDRIRIMDEIGKKWLQGTRNVTQIAKEMKMTRKEVMAYVEEYKQIAYNDDEVRARAKEALHEADSALNLVNEENWGLVNRPGVDDKVKATVLKNIADIERSRVDMLQKAGLYDDAALGDELAEMEEKQQILINILKEVTSSCDKCKHEVARRLAKVTGKAEPVVVIEGALVPANPR